MSELTDPQPKPSIWSLVFRLIQLLIIGIISLDFLPFYLIGRIFWDRPPIVPHWSQVRRYLGYAWSAQPSEPGLSWQARVWLTISILRKWILTPIIGIAWQLDELLYGRAINEAKIVEPLFVISGGRSGSTQITRYIEADPHVTAPNLLQAMFPYMWLWKLAPRTIGRLFPPEKVRERLEGMMPPELLERHEFDPFNADTFDGAFFTGHLNPLAFYLGPDISASEFSFARFPAEDQSKMEQDFVSLVDRIGRKHLIFAGQTQSENSARLFIKGHFLCAAEALAQQYPDATFLTVIRDPAPRLQSGINYLRVNPSDGAIGPPPWGWLSQSLLRSESEYCRDEQEWYLRDDDRRKCVIKFVDFVNDLEGTMGEVYQVCLGLDELPAHVPRTHPPRERKNYLVNHSLEELGIDAEALRTDLADYVAWCQPEA